LLSFPKGICVSLRVTLSYIFRKTALAREIAGQKNSLKSWRVFSDQNDDCFLTSFTTHFTTTSPQKHHVKTPENRKTPSKNALSTTLGFF
jgi:hypothetical protein